MEDDLRVALHKSRSGARASLELGPGGEDGSITLVDSFDLGTVLSASAACQMAAWKLRVLADRFDVLAIKANAFTAQTQTDVNGMWELDCEG